MPGPIPQPPRSAPPAIIAEQSPLGNIFGIQNEAFSRYMRLVGTQRPNALEILEGCVAAADAEGHPLVQYAAGSAATELALRTTRGPLEAPYTFAMRKAMLDKGKAYCLTASEGLADLGKKYWDPHLGLQLAQIGVRALHLAAYTPLMEIVAANIADHFLPQDTLEAKRIATRTDTAHLGQLILGMDSVDANSLRYRIGLRGEAACGMVGQGGGFARHFLLPASLRQDHNYAADLRADLIAMEIESPFRKTLLQVANKRKPNSESASSKHCRVQINASRDLVLRPHWSVDRTLETFVALSEGTASPEAEQLFAATGRSLSMYIDAFIPKRKKRSKP